MIAKTTFATKNKNKLDIIDKNLSPCRRRSGCQIRCWLHPTRCRCCGPAPPSPAAEPRPEIWNTKHRHTPLLSNQKRTRRLLLTSCCWTLCRCFFITVVKIWNIFHVKRWTEPQTSRLWLVSSSHLQGEFWHCVCLRVSACQWLCL